MIFNVVHLHADNHFIIRSNKITCGHPFTLVKPLCKARARSDFVARRVVDA